MIKKESFEIMNLIHAYYPNFEVTQERIDAWHLILCKFAFEDVRKNVVRFAEANKFSPTVHELTANVRVAGIGETFQEKYERLKREAEQSKEGTANG